MAVWSISTELVNKNIGLRKVYATRIDNAKSQTFFVKARTKTLEERKKVWDEIYRQNMRNQPRLYLTQ